MDDFKDSTRTKYLSKGDVRGAAQMNHTMKCFKEGGAVYGPADEQAPAPASRRAANPNMSGSQAPERPVATLDVGRIGKGVKSGLDGRTAGRGYGVTARIPFKEGGSVKGKAKIGKVMGEFGEGKLHSGSKKGPIVTNPKQATAIALSEARKAGAKIPVKKARGGNVADPNSAARESDLERTRSTGALGAAVARGNRVQAEEAGEMAVRRGVPAYNSEPAIKSRSYAGRAGDIPVRKR